MNLRGKDLICTQDWEISESRNRQETSSRLLARDL